MVVYEVVSKWYGDGKCIVSFHTYEMKSKPENKVIERVNSETYHDYFTNKKIAKEFYSMAKKIGK